MLVPSDFVIKQMIQYQGLNRGNVKLRYSNNPLDDAKWREALRAQDAKMKALLAKRQRESITGY